MRPPNQFLIQRKALARFRTKIPFLALIPDSIYHALYPSEWYEPFGEIEQARKELERKLHCYVMTYKRHRPFIPWERQLFVYIEDADLSLEQKKILNTYNDTFWDFGIEFEAYKKPLTIRKTPLEHPFAYCEPPDEDEPMLPVRVDPEDIPF
jgi:hypothetical protein